MRTCHVCGVSIETSRPQARTCSAACRAVGARRAEDTVAARDAAAAVLLLRERTAVAALRAATTDTTRARAERELDRIGAHVDRLFEGTPD